MRTGSKENVYDDEVILQFREKPYATNGFSHHYHFGESTVTFSGIGDDFKILFHVSIKFLKANIIALDGTPCSAASHLGLYCLPMSHKKDARLKRVKEKLGILVRLLKFDQTIQDFTNDDEQNAQDDFWYI